MLIWINIRVLPTGTRSLVSKASARQAVDLGSNLSECHIFYLFRCVLSSLLPLRSAGRSNFDNGLHNLITLIQKTTYNNDIAILHNGINCGQL